MKRLLLILLVPAVIAAACGAEDKDQSAHVQQAILSLPAASRAVLILREYQGLSYKEIAQVLDIPVGTVMSRLNYARGRLKSVLAPLLEVL